MHHPVHAEKRAKSHCNYIGLKELRGPVGNEGWKFPPATTGLHPPFSG